MREFHLYKFPKENGMQTNFFHLIELAKRINIENPPGKLKIRKLKAWVKKIYIII